MFAKAEIKPSVSTEMFQIPIESLVEGNGNKAFVFLLESDKVHIKKALVNIAFVKDNSAFIQQGLDGVENVITAGSGFLTESSLVQLVSNP